METLVRYDWPGNVRELQNAMERCVILSSSAVLQSPELADVSCTGEHLGPRRKPWLMPNANSFCGTLRDTDWVIGGPYGAALRLGVKRTTLIYKMQRLDITRPITVWGVL